MIRLLSEFEGNGSIHPKARRLQARKLERSCALWDCGGAISLGTMKCSSCTVTQLDLIVPRPAALANAQLLLIIQLIEFNVLDVVGIPKDVVTNPGKQGGRLAACFLNGY
jgi:hypothetical protein